MTDQITRKRVQSARPFVERQRPLSSRPHQIEQKTEFIQKVYYNVPGLSERPSSGKNKMKINSLYTTKNIKLKESGFEKQVLVEENMLLKKKVNMLEMQISQLNSKMIVTRNKNSKNKKTLDVEFENQTLWTGKNSYLVTGVKNQYEKLKVQYQKKCQQLSQIMQKLNYTKLVQLQKAYKKLETYSQELLQKNISLEQKINASKSTPLASSSFSERNYHTSQLIIEDLNLRLAQTQEKLAEKKQQISKHNQNIQIKITRIRFLQKLALQKDNAIHALHLKNKKLQKEKEFFIQQINRLKEKLQQAQKQSEFRISNILESQQRRVNRERDIYSKIIDEKNTNISKLEKQVAYLTTLMSYWKPLDEESRKNDNSPIRQINIVQVEQKKTEQDKSRKSAALGESLGLLGRAFSQRISETNSVARQKTQIQVIEKPRQQKKADVKRSDDAKKVRPVREAEVEDIGELIRFRLIAKRISITQVKAILSNQIQSQSINDESDQTNLWENEYITMKQIYNVLLQEPFNLSQSQAHLFSRYLIQDVQNDHIYCAWDNQNKREVVKSILKNTIKDYEVNQSLQQIEKQTALELEKYRSRISTILQQMYKDGFISKKKLSEIFVGSGFELRQSVMEYLIGKLAVQSQSLDRLKYTALF